MASGIIQGSVSVPANSQIDDVLVNQILAANRQGASVVDGAIVCSAAGLLATLQNGMQTIAPEFAPAPVNRTPVMPDDFTLPRFGLLGADRLLLKARNPTGGALTLFWSFRLQHVS